MGNLEIVKATRVNEFITWALKRAPFEVTASTGSSGPPTATDINAVAWDLLKTVVRGDHQHRYDQDFEAAAAEHYLYIRFLASLTGDPYCYAAPALYAAKKVFDQMTGRLQAGRAQAGHPVLPANPYIVAWGQKGVKDGLADYKKTTDGAPYRFGAAVEALASFSYSTETARKFGKYARNPLGGQ